MGSSGHERWTTYEHLKQQVLRWYRDGRADLTGIRKWRADLSNGCPNPFLSSVFARTALSRKNTGRRLSLELAVGCKKKTCEVCMNRLAKVWMARASAEYRASERTWMVTLTMSPSEHAILDLKASLGVTEDVTLEEARIRAFGVEVRRWYRRLHGEKPRDIASYLGVAELHDSARTSELMRRRPHFHVLLHEKKAGALIPDTDCEFVEEGVLTGASRTVYRVKDSGRAKLAWTRGLSKLVLCYDERSAVYVCKYLHKDGVGAVGRVRASPHYGSPESSPIASVGSISDQGNGNDRLHADLRGPGRPPA